MKKYLSLLLALVLALSCAGAACADVLLESEGLILGSFDSEFCIGDTLYISSDQGIYEWNPGDEKPTYYTFDMESLENWQYTFSFASGDKLYAIRVCLETEDDYTELTQTELCELTLGDGTATFEGLADLNWEELTGENDNGVTIYRPRKIVVVNGVAFIVYTDWGDGSELISRVGALDIEEGSVTLLDDLENSVQISAYKDDKLLLLNWEPDSEEISYATYDPEAEELETLCTVDYDDRHPLSGLAYDAEDDIAYITQDNEVHTVDLETGELGAVVANVTLPYLFVYTQGLVLGDGSYVVGSGEVAILDVSGDRSDITKINVCDTQYSMVLDTAIQKLAAVDNRVTVNVTRDAAVLDNMVENLVNQDSSVDIYIIDTTSPVYDALYKRGYMMSLDDCENIVALVDRMYPAEKESLYADGHLVALPVDVSATAAAFSKAALEKLGMTLDDVPNNWSDMLDFIASQKDAMEENDIRLAVSFQTADAVRQAMFNQMFGDYQNYMNLTDVEMGYNTELLSGLMEKLEKLDLLALGCAEDEDDLREEDYEVFFGGDSSGILMDPGMDCTFNSFSGDAFSPVLLAMNSESTGNLVVKNIVAFINPYSAHPEAAKTFMKVIADNLSNATMYTLIPDLNEPVRGELNQQVIDEMEEVIEDLRKQVEKAEGAKRTLLEDDLASREDNLETIKKSFWEINQSSLDWYRPHAESMTVATTNWLDDEAMSMINQYLNGDIAVDEMLESIDRKVKMMRMEGN